LNGLKAYFDQFHAWAPLIEWNLSLSAEIQIGVTELQFQAFVIMHLRRKNCGSYDNSRFVKQNQKQKFLQIHPIYP